jgi:hypothetical protein
MHDEGPTSGAAPPTNRRREVLATGQSGSRRQHRGDPVRDQAESWLRPLRRRAAMMARPARVRIRSRNPWVLARRRLFGWNVRLPLVTAVVLPVSSSSAAWGTAGLDRSRLHGTTSTSGSACAPGPSGSVGERAHKNTRRLAGDHLRVSA